MNRKQAWMVFLNQYLVTHGDGYLEYRRLLAIDIQLVIDKWIEFIDNQYKLENINESQHTQWNIYYPVQIQRLIAVRKIRGDPSGLPSGNPNFKRKDNAKI